MHMNWHLEPKFSEKLSGDKIILPLNVLESLNEQDFQIFQLSHGTRIEYCTVREFTAESKTMLISPSIAMQFHPLPSQLLVKPATLPKCSFAKLVPITANYSVVRDLRSLLESHIRSNYGVLTQGHILDIPLRNGIVKFEIQKLLPEKSCSCIDTDIEIDIEPTLDMLSELSRHQTMRWEDEGESKVIAITGKTTDTNYYKIPNLSDKSMLFYRIELILISGDADLLLSDINEYPSWTDHLAVDAKSGDCVLDYHRNPEEWENVGNLFIAVIAATEYSEFRLVVRAFKRKEEDENTMHDDETTEVLDGMKQCLNCWSKVPEYSFARHSAFCERQNIKCQRCSKIFQKKDFSSHWHCEMCSVVL